MVFVMLRITPPVLTPTLTHESTSWQIASDPDFNDVVAESLGDTDNKLVKTFSLDLDSTQEYYARARVELRDSVSDNLILTDWTDIDVIVPTDTTDLNLEVDIPSVVSRPTVSVNFPVDNMPTTLFNITTSEFGTNSNAGHVSTSYIILTDENDPVFSNIEDNDNLTQYLFTDDILQEGKVYIIVTAHHSSSNDVSDFGKLLIKTAAVPEIKPLFSRFVDKNSDLEAKIEQVKDISKIHYKLIAMLPNTPDYDIRTTGEVDVESNGFNWTIDKSHYATTTPYHLLTIQLEYDNGDMSNIKYVPLIIKDIQAE